MRAIILLIIIGLTLICGSNALVYTSYGVLCGSYGDVTTVTIPDTGDIASTTWLIDGKPTSAFISNTELTYTFSDPGMHIVTANVVYNDGSNSTQTFTMLGTRHMDNGTTDPIVFVSTPVTQEKITSDVADLNVTGGWEDMTSVFTDKIGMMFYGILFALPLFFMWINQRKLTMPTTLFLLFGWLIIGLVPAQFHYVIWIAIVVSFSLPFLKMIHPN